jgi:hypothetical protein
MLRARRSLPLVAVAALVAAPGALAAQAKTQSSTAAAREAVGHTASVSARSADVTFDMSDGSQLKVTLSRGTVFVNGDSVGAYAAGGPFEKSWRAILSKAGDLGTPQLVFALRNLPSATMGPDAKASMTAITAALPSVSLGNLGGPPPDIAELASAQAKIDSLKQSIQGIGAVIGAAESRRISRELARGLARQGLGEVSGSAFGLGRLATDVAGLFGTLVALASLGFGALFFVPQRLEVVAETVRRSPIRAFFAGLFAQPLLLPALVTLIIGLVLTVVGILVVPVAIIAFVLAVAAGLVGGYLAVARVVGEIYVRRRGQQGQYTSGWTSYRYLLYGVIGLLAIWAPAVLLRSIPAAGVILVITALVFTWAMATTGFGAVILSKGGVGTWALRRPAMPELSSEYVWTAPARHAEVRRGDGV